MSQNKSLSSETKIPNFHEVFDQLKEVLKFMFRKLIVFYLRQKQFDWLKTWDNSGFIELGWKSVKTVQFFKAKYDSRQVF